MNWDYKLSHQAVKRMKRFPAHDRKRIIVVLDEMKADPFYGDIKLMRGEENLYRRRVGNYRIYFRPKEAGHILEIPEIERKQSR